VQGPAGASGLIISSGSVRRVSAGASSRLATPPDPSEPEEDAIPKDGETLAEVGEDGLIAALLARFAAEPPSATGQVLVGPGDDAAVLRAAGRLVACTDTLVQGFDFRLEWSTGHDVGVKVAAQNLADIAAMGGHPIGLLVSLSAPPDLAVSWARALAEGLADECGRAGASVIGGDLSEASELVVVGTALGALQSEPVLRSGAAPGQQVALAGPTGRSAAGLALLSAGLDPSRDPMLSDPVLSDPVLSDPVLSDPVLSSLVSWHLAPRPDYSAGPAAAAAGATAMIDTSDGLLRDAARLAEASVVVLDLDPSALRLGPDLLRAAEALGSAPGEAAAAAARRWQLTGGEDHSMLACFPADAALPAGFVAVGQVLPGPGKGAAGSVLVGGQPWRGRPGWQHFS
jgi:thiamine-monophosphate kinase